MLNANEKRAHSVHGIQYTYTFFHSAPAVPITIHTNAGASTFFFASFRFLSSDYTIISNLSALFSCLH